MVLGAGWAPWQVRTGAEISLPPEFDPRTVQSVASHYAYWAIPALPIVHVTAWRFRAGCLIPQRNAHIFNWPIDISAFDILRIPSPSIHICNNHTAATVTPLATGLVWIYRGSPYGGPNFPVCLTTQLFRWCVFRPSTKSSWNVIHQSTHRHISVHSRPPQHLSQYLGLLSTLIFQ